MFRRSGLGPHGEGDGPGGFEIARDRHSARHRRPGGGDGAGRAVEQPVRALAANRALLLRRSGAGPSCLVALRPTAVRKLGVPYYSWCQNFAAQGPTLEEWTGPRSADGSLGEAVHTTILV